MARPVVARVRGVRGAEESDLAGMRANKNERSFYFAAFLIFGESPLEKKR
jgi:hypothetical protein